MGICRLKLPISGSDEEMRRQVECIVREVVPEARCEIWDYQHKYRCGVVTEKGQKVEVSFVRRGVSDADVRIHAEKLSQMIADATGSV